MADMAQLAESVAGRYALLRDHLDERQRRLLLGVEAAQIGRGGIKAIAAATGVHPDTIARGVREVEGDSQPQPRVRAAGGGRKRLTHSTRAWWGCCGSWSIRRLGEIRCRRWCGPRSRPGTWPV